MIKNETKPGTILKETIEHIRSILKERMDTITVERVSIGLFFTGVKLSDGSGGVCFTPIKEIPEAVCCPSSANAMPRSGKLKGKTVASFIDRIDQNKPVEKAISLAILNALSATCWKENPPSGYSFQTGGDPVDQFPISPESHVVVIGALVPYIKMLREGGYSFNILERDSRTLKVDELPYFVPPERAKYAIATADLLIVTGVTVLNDSIDEILSQIRPGAQVIIVGPTASMLPDAFFRRGVHAIGSITVTDSDQLLDILAEGGSGYHFYGKSAERLVLTKTETVATAM